MPGSRRARGVYPQRDGDAHANAFVFANSGGKDCALVGILCKMACEDTLAIMMPCHAKRNYGEDMADAVALCEQFHIAHITVDLTARAGGDA